MGNFPLPVANIALLDQKMATLIEFSKNSPSKIHVPKQCSVDSCYATLLRVDKDVALQAR